MKCSQCRLLIDDVGDMDRLPSEAARHVASCRACDQFGAELISLRSLLREPARVTAPDSFDASLARRLRVSKASPPSRVALLWSLRPQTSLAAAAAFLLVCSGALVVSRYEMSPQPDHGANIVATNRPGSMEPGVSVEAPVTIGTDVPLHDGARLVTVAANEVSRSPRSVVRPRDSSRMRQSEDAVLLVSDDQGSRLVDVPNVLFGSEMIVPDAASGDGDASDTVSF